MVIPSTVGKKDPYLSRLGISLALKECAELFNGDLVLKMMHFMIDDCALGDRNESVRKGMLEVSVNSTAHFIIISDHF
jgi:hypothetical protein